MKIDTISVERIVRSISNTTPTSDHSSSSPPATNGGDSPPAPKKAALEPVADVEMMESKSSELEPSSMNVDTEESKPCSSPGMGLSLSPSVLYEYTAHNYNVMHVCVARKDRDDDGSSKQFIPYKGEGLASVEYY